MLQCPNTQVKVLHAKCCLSKSTKVAKKKFEVPKVKVLFMQNGSFHSTEYEIIVLTDALMCSSL